MLCDYYWKLCMLNGWQWEGRQALCLEVPCDSGQLSCLVLFVSTKAEGCSLLTPFASAFFLGFPRKWFETVVSSWLSAVILPPEACGEGMLGKGCSVVGRSRACGPGLPTSGLLAFSP